MILLLLGGAVLRASLTDIYLRYVKESLQPFLIEAGALLCLAAVMTIIYELARTTKTIITGTMSRGSAGCCLPRCLACCWSPRRAGRLRRRAERLGPAAGRQPVPPLPEGDPAGSACSSFTRAIFGKGKSMRGRTVKLSGFCRRGQAGGGADPDHARLLRCRRPSAEDRHGGQPARGLADDRWVEVVGRYSATTEKDR